HEEAKNQVARQVDKKAAQPLFLVKRVTVRQPNDHRCPCGPQIPIRDTQGQSRPKCERRDSSFSQAGKIRLSGIDEPQQGHEGQVERPPDPAALQQMWRLLFCSRWHVTRCSSNEGCCIITSWSDDTSGQG